MKILMVLDHEFPPDIRVENEIEVLSKAGHKVFLACFTLKNKKKNELTDSVHIYRKPISPFIYKTSVGALKAPFYFNFWRKYLNNLLKEQSFDAIHIHDLPLAKVGFEISKKYNIPFILDLHENWPHLLRDAKHTNTFFGKILSSNKQWDKYEKNYTNKADRIITVVDEMKNRIINLGNPKNKIFVVQNSINLNNIEKTKPKNTHSPNDELILMYAGGITAPRGIQYVIEGLSYLKNRKVKLWIVGDGIYKQELMELTSRLKLENTVHFFGFKPFNETMKLVAKSDIALIPHVRSIQNDNSSPNKLFQYMYYGKPVIASNCLSVERIVREENVGFIYEYNNPKAFAKTVEKILDNPEQLINLSNNGIKSIQEKYNWDKTGQELLFLYNSL